MLCHRVGENHEELKNGVLSKRKSETGNEDETGDFLFGTTTAKDL